MSVSVTGAMLSMSPCRAYCMVPVMAETSKSDMDVCTSKATSCGIWKPDSWDGSAVSDSVVASMLTCVS